MSPGGIARRLVEQLNSPCKIQIRIFRAQRSQCRPPRARLEFHFFAEDDGRSPRRSDSSPIARVRKKRQLARLRRLDAGHAGDLDAGVALEPAVQPLRNLPKFHGCVSFPRESIATDAASHREKAVERGKAVGRPQLTVARGAQREKTKMGRA